MNDLLVVLSVIAIVLTIVTLVGHGIWVLLAAIFGGGRRKPGQKCPFCGRSTPLGRDRCDWCSRDLTNLLARELSDLDVVRRQLQRFRENGTLKPEVVDRLSQRLQNYRQQLRSPGGQKRAAPPVAAVILEEAQADRSAAAPPAAPSQVRAPSRAPVAPGRGGPDVLATPPAVSPAIARSEALEPVGPEVPRRLTPPARQEPSPETVQPVVPRSPLPLPPHARRSPWFRPWRWPRPNRSRSRPRAPGPRCWPPSWNSGIFAGAS